MEKGDYVKRTHNHGYAYPIPLEQIFLLSGLNGEMADICYKCYGTNSSIAVLADSLEVVKYTSVSRVPKAIRISHENN